MYVLLRPLATRIQGCFPGTLNCSVVARQVPYLKYFTCKICKIHAAPRARSICPSTASDRAYLRVKMSDFDSPADTPVPTHSRPSKRRRVYDDSEASTPRESSSDERNHHRPTRSSKLRARQDRRSQSSEGIEDEDRHYRPPSRSASTPRTSRSRSPAEPPSPPSYKPLKLNYKPKLVLNGHRKGVSQVRFSPDGKWIASCSADGTIKIWDAVSGKHMRTLEGHLAGVSTIAWSPDSKTLASGSDDKAIRLWDRASGKPYPAALLGHHNYVYSLAFSPKGNMLVSGSYDEAVFLWDLRARRQMRSLPAHSDPVGGVDFIRDGTLVCSCSTDGLMYASSSCDSFTIANPLPSKTSLGHSNRTMLANSRP